MNKLSLIKMLRKISMTAAFSLCTLALFAQGVRVTGTVTDTEGQPVPGATIAVKGSTTGTVADADGKYSITVPNSESTLVFSSVGYNSQEVVVGDQREINPQLAEGLQLDEVVVTGMGISKEAKKLGYAVATIKAEELTKVGSPNFGTALYGKASGVRITNAPGGSATGVSINVRGLSSINGNTQPVIYVDGMPIRNGNSEDKFNSFEGFGYASNGLTDINPENIESLTILKGASATALYGSEGANGVVLITTKKAHGTGITVDFNATVQANLVAYIPKIQTEFGPGTWTAGKSDYELAHGGFNTIKVGDITYDYVNIQGTTHSYGPKFDGRMVMYPDGKLRAYNPQSMNPWAELFQNGMNQQYNLAVNQNSTNAQTRFSYTYMNELPNVPNSNLDKHNVQINGTLKGGDRFKVDYLANFILNKWHNRAGEVTGAMDSFSNMFNAFADVDMFREKYKTPLGYKRYSQGSSDTIEPDDTWTGGLQGWGWIQNYFWDHFENERDQTDIRFLGNIAPSFQILPYLTARGRISADISASKMEQRNATERPLATADPSGEYKYTNRRYDMYSGEAMLVFNKELNEMFTLGATAGWQIQGYNEHEVSLRTEGGLTIENSFNLGSSYRTVVWNQNRGEKLNQAIFGQIDVSFNDYLFLNVTGRQEKSSTLPAKSNSYFYPSASLAFLYTEAFKNSLPEWYDYGKVRFSYGIVGNAPNPYAANIVYDQYSQGSTSHTAIPNTLGNEDLVAEKLTEIEIGLENKMFKGRVGFEVSLYQRTTSDMIITQPIADSDGADEIWINAGEMVNKGVEVSVNFIPLETRDFRWEVFSNLLFSKNKVTKLAPGIEYLRTAANAGNSGGGINGRSYIDRAFGDLYVCAPVTVTDESSPYYGQPIVKFDDDEKHFGYYDTPSGDANQSFAGNSQARVIGGLGTTLTYKKWSLDIMTDFRFGGMVMNSSMHYPTARGLSPNSLAYRSAEHGGLEYQYKGYTMDNGMIIPGVVETKDASGNVTYVPNENISACDYYYNVTYNWGQGGGTTYAFSVFENSYWKLRELALSYQFDVSGTFFKRLNLSVFGRNLFYFYKTLDDIDAEAASGGGTSWGTQTGVGYSAAGTRSFGVALRASF